MRPLAQATFSCDNPAIHLGPRPIELRATPLPLRFAVGQGELRSKRGQPGLGRSYSKRSINPILLFFAISAKASIVSIGSG